MVTPFRRGAVLGAPARRARLADIAGDGGILVLAPHPDDESLAMGAAIAMAAREGRGVQVVLLTDGGRSHHSTRLPADRLARLRARELREALRHLGVMRPAIRLGHPDQGAPERPTPAENARIGQAAAAIGATAIWTCWRHDPHPDHQRGARFAAAAAQQLGLPQPVEAPVWGRFTNAAPEGAVLRLQAPGWALARKRAAIAAHRSQMTRLIPDDPDGFVMDPATQAHFRDGDELFLLPGPP